jgi:hypothetical protein
MINVKKITSSHALKAAASTKIAKAVIPVPKATATVKAVAPAVHQVQSQTPQQRQQSQETDWFKPKIIQEKTEQPKKVLSAKHIVKPKKAAPPKKTAPFTIVFSSPAVTPKVVQRKPEAPPKLVSQPIPVVELKPAVLAIAVAPPEPVAQTEPAPPPKPTSPAPVYPPHEIKQSNVSLKEDILANPHDYETQVFPFDLQCPNSHYWRAGRALPVSNGRAFCLQCGE